MAKYAPEDTTTEYDPPTVENYGEEAIDNTTISNETTDSGLASEADPLLTIFTKQLDNLHLFVLGRWPDNTQEGRRKFILDTIRLFDNIANAAPMIAKDAIRHFIANVRSCPHPYIDGAFNSPLYKTRPPRSVDVDRYFSLITLLITLAQELGHAQRYIAGRDLNYILRKYSVKQRTTLIAVITSIGR